MSFNKPTPRQRDALVAINSLWLLNEYAPTYDEIAMEMGGMSKVYIWELVNELEMKGLISREKFGARTIRLTEEGRSWLQSND
jgi:repressor LexA